MPIRLIIAIIFMVLVAVFTGFNLDHRCTIWFFREFENVPVVQAVIGSFVLGVLVTLPFTFGKRRPKKAEERDSAKKKEKRRPAKKPRKEPEPTVPAVVPEPEAPAVPDSPENSEQV